MTRMFTLQRVFGKLAGQARSWLKPVLSGFGLWAIAVWLGAGCAAIYPEIATPLKAAPPGRELSPPPPTDVLYLAIREVEIPPKTRDGRAWDELGKGAPDPYAKVFLNDKQLFVTSTESDSFKPKWADAPKQNYRVPKGSVLRVEVWDDNAVISHPICAKEFKSLHEKATEYGQLKALCYGGARMLIDLKPAEAKFGLGLYYELRADSVVITRTAPLSPASRAGLAGGEEVLEVMGRPVKKMDNAQLRSLINANAPQGVTLKIRHGNVSKDIVLKEGPIYTKGNP